jgi:hypothetical protein
MFVLDNHSKNCLSFSFTFDYEHKNDDKNFFDGLNLCLFFSSLLFLFIMMNKSSAQPSHYDDYGFDPQHDFSMVLIFFLFQLLVFNIVSTCLDSLRV